MLFGVTEFTEPKSDKSMHSIVDDASVVTEQTDGSRDNVPELTDLIKTPQKRPSKRKKKFMPKVVVEGKKKKLKESATKTLVNVGDTSNVTSPEVTVKSCRRALNFNVNKTGDVSNTSPEVTIKSCRRAKLDKTGDEKEGDSESETVQNNSNSNSISDDATGSFLDSVTQIDQPLEAWIRNQSDKLEEARGSKRQYQQNPQSQDSERRKSRRCAEYLDAAKKTTIQKVVQENLHGMSPEVLEIEDDPPDGAREEKCNVPKTPARTIRARRKQPTRAKSYASKTTRKRNLLMEKGEQEDDEAHNKRKEKWWEEERRVFRERAESFISLMHLVQGNRRFSPWKGSVVDSVIGVFLTQSVSDHVSSSAFMSLAARFPPKSIPNKVQSPSDTQISVVESGSKEQQRDNSNSGIKIVELVENSTKSLEEEVVSSSHDYFDPVMFESCGRVGSCSGSKTDTEFWTKPASGSMQTGSLNLSAEICHRSERPVLYEGSGDGQKQEAAKLVRKAPDLDKTMKGKESLFFRQPSNDTKWHKGPTNPSSSYEQSTIQQPEVLDIEDFGKEREHLGRPFLSISPKVEGGKRRYIARTYFRQRKKYSAHISPKVDRGKDKFLSRTYIRRRKKEHTTVETNATILRELKGTDRKKPTSHWDNLRKDVEEVEGRKKRSEDSLDSIDYDAVRRASISEVSNAIKERGLNNLLALRIKDFLDRIARDHGALDLEWLRDAPADRAKAYLLSFTGLGLKSVECVRLLTLHKIAFPVDTNVARVAVRLGWVPIDPLPESLQLHLLERYPMLDSVQKFLWPRLCNFDQPTLYELHYQLISFGKVFCTKTRPNCNSCPMKGQCKHFASAYSSAKHALPAPEEKSLTRATIPAPPEYFPHLDIPMLELPPLEKSQTSGGNYCEPIIEEPASPKQEESPEITERDIEDYYYNDDPDEIPTIDISMVEDDMSKSLVVLNAAKTYIPNMKLKNCSRLRTEHEVYVLPDSHPLLHGMDRREKDDPSHYLLAIWTAGETASSSQPPEQKCGGQASGKMCFEETCSECNSVMEAKSETVRGTILIPCRTGMRGSFPLNGTYFQVNEVFADQESSLKPIDVPRDLIWKLPRRTVYFGTSVTSIFRGLSTGQIQSCFWKGYVCVRGFEQKTRAPRPLMARLHFKATKVKKTSGL